MKRTYKRWIIKDRVKEPWVWFGAMTIHQWQSLLRSRNASFTVSKGKFMIAVDEMDSGV